MPKQFNVMQYGEGGAGGGPIDKIMITALAGEYGGLSCNGLGGESAGPQPP